MTTTNATTPVKAAQPATLTEALAAVAAAKRTSNELYRAFEAAEAARSALEDIYQPAINAAVAAVKIPTDLFITLTGTSIVKTVMVHTLANGETREHVISNETKAALTTEAEIRRTFADAPESCERALAALAQWEADKEAARVAATPKALIKADRAEDRADRRWRASIRKVSEAATAILRVPSTTPAELAAKLKAYGQSCQGIPKNKKAKLFEYLGDEEAFTALNVVYQELASASPPPSPTAPPQSFLRSVQAERERVAADIDSSDVDTPEAVMQAKADRMVQLDRNIVSLPIRSRDDAAVKLEEALADHRRGFVIQADNELFRQVLAYLRDRGPVAGDVSPLAYHLAEYRRLWADGLTMTDEQREATERFADEQHARPIWETPCRSFADALVKLDMATERFRECAEDDPISAEVNTWAIKLAQEAFDYINQPLGGSNPDVELLALAAEWKRAEAAMWTASEAVDAMDRADAGYAAAEAALGAAEAEADTLRNRLIATPARTPAGVALKAAAALPVAAGGGAASLIVLRDAASLGGQLPDGTDCWIADAIRSDDEAKAIFDAGAHVDEYEALGGQFTLYQTAQGLVFGTSFPRTSTPRSRAMECELVAATWKEQLVIDELRSRGRELQLERPQEQSGATVAKRRKEAPALVEAAR